MSPPCECKAGDKGHVTTFQTKLRVQNEEVPKPSEKQPACAGTLPRLASVHLFLTPALSLLSDHELLIWPKCRMSFVLITGGWTHSPQAWVTIQFTIYTLTPCQYDGPVSWGTWSQQNHTELSALLLLSPSGQPATWSPLLLLAPTPLP